MKNLLYFTLILTMANVSDSAQQWLFSNTDTLPEFCYEERQRIRKKAWFWQVERKMKEYDASHQPPSDRVLLDIGRKKYLRKYCGTVPFAEDSALIELGRCKAQKTWRGWTCIL